MTPNGNGMLALTSESDDTRRYAKLLQADVITLTRLLTTHAKIDEAKRIVTFDAGWSDARLLALIKVTHAKPDMLNIGHVTNFRREYFGKTPDELRVAATEASKRNPFANQATRAYQLATELEQKVVDLTKRVQDLEDMVTRG